MKKLLPYLIGAGIAVLVFLVCLLMPKCEGTKETLKTGTYKTVKEAQGDTIKGKSVDSLRIDTVVKWKDSKVVIKKVIIQLHDTLNHYFLANDEVNMGAYTFTISDTIRGDSIDRKIKVVQVDSTHFITRVDLRVDTVFKSKTDTLVQEKKGAYWRGLKHGFLIGGITGLVGGVAIIK